MVAKTNLQLEERHKFLLIKVFGEGVGTGGHHHVAIVVEEAHREERRDKLPLVLLKSLVLLAT